MQHEIDDRLARALLAGEIRDGDTVRVDLSGDELTVARFDLPASA
jgi:ATP-dependent Clp protease ATP-binding subunit ClpB